jgi:hypothetical protein
MGEKQLKQSKAFQLMGYKNVSELIQRAAEKQSSTADTEALLDLKEVTGAVVELNIVAENAAIRLKEMGKPVEVKS